MATNQQHTDGAPSVEGPTIDETPTISPPQPNNDVSQENAPNASTEKPNPATDALPKYTPPKIDVTSGPAMVTPVKLLQTGPQWIDCPFCKQMAQTKVTVKEESEEPSGLMMCLVCLVCCPLLLCLPMMTGKTQSWIHACSSCNSVVAVRGPQGIQVKEPAPSRLVPSKFGAANHPSAA